MDPAPQPRRHWPFPWPPDEPFPIDPDVFGPAVQVEAALVFQAYAPITTLTDLQRAGDAATTAPGLPASVDDGGAAVDHVWRR